VGVLEELNKTLTVLEHSGNKTQLVLCHLLHLYRKIGNNDN